MNLKSVSESGSASGIGGSLYFQLVIRHWSLVIDLNPCPSVDSLYLFSTIRNWQLSYISIRSVIWNLLFVITAIRPRFYRGF